jgi:ankyrin repeat protein
MSPLSLAVSRGSPACVLVLLGRGAKALPDEDPSPLIRAVESGYTEVVHTLLTNGAATPDQLRQSLSLALSPPPNAPLVGLLLGAGAPLATKSPLGHTATSLFTSLGDARSLGLALSLGADVTGTFGPGSENLAQLGAKGRHGDHAVEVLRVLQQAGVEVGKVVGGGGRTALHEATTGAVVRYLLDEGGASADAVGERDDCVLHSWADTHPPPLEALEAFVDAVPAATLAHCLSLRNDDGETALLTAVNARPFSLAFSLALLHAGADPTADDGDGESPLSFVQEKVDDEQEGDGPSEWQELLTAMEQALAPK